MMTWITAAILVVLTLSGGDYYLDYYEVAGVTDLCADGEIWVQQNDATLYYCPSEDSYQYCSSLTSSEKSCYIMESIGTGEMPIRTTSTETICRIIDGKKSCNLVLYSGIRFVQEDNQWKKVEDARSLKGKGFNVVYLEDDGTHKIEVVDFNMTYIELSFSYDKDNLGEFEFEVEEGKMKTKYKIVETFFDETGLPYDVETEIEIEIEEEGQENIIYYGNPFGKRFKLGENSTTIKLQEPDTENLDDAELFEAFADFNMGAATRLMLRSDTSSVTRIYTKFNISIIPSGQQIDEARLYLYKYNDVGSNTHYYLVHQVYNITWTEGTLSFGSCSTPSDCGFGITWNNQPCGTAFDDSAQCNLTFEDNISIVGGVENIWHNWTVTNMVKKSYNDGDTKISIVTKDASEGEDSSTDWAEFRSKEYTDDTTLRPTLNITYSEIVVPEDPVVNLDSPTNNTFSNVLNQIFNSSYTATAGDLVNATLSIWNSTASVYNETELVTGSSNSSSLNFTFSVDGVYAWNYEVCNDSVLCASNSTNWTITIDTTPPTFDNLADQDANANSSFLFDIDATDATTSVSCFTVNDTTNFQIDCDGILQNNTVLSLQVYNLNITVNDTLNNVASGIMSVDVTTLDTILRWDWSALMTDVELPDQICFLFRNSEYCIDEITPKNIFVPQYIFVHNNATMVLASANVWANITFDQEVTEIKKGIVHTFDDNTNHTFTINTDGIYDITYNFDVIDTSGSSTDIDVAGRIIYSNGTEILGSVFETDITKKNIETEISHSTLANLVKGDVIVFQFVAGDVDVEISTHGTFGDHPESVTVKIDKIANT